MRYFVVLFFIFLSSGCVTAYSNTGLKLTEESDYLQVLDKFTVHKQVYDGFNETIDFHIYFLNSYLTKYQIDQNARIYQWNTGQYDAEKTKVENSLSKETTFFLSFFTPDRHNDDLQKEKTKWRIFLDVNGSRYEAKVEKPKTPYAEILSLYPQHNKWSSGYKLIFPVPTRNVENQKAVFTITGPVGHAEVEFPVLSQADENRESKPVENVHLPTTEVTVPN